MPRQLTAIVIGTVGLVFFVALTLYSYRQGARGRGYLTGLLLIIFVCLNTLIRGLFYPGASPDPSTLSGMWRLANGVLAVVGGLLLEREWRRQRKAAQKGDA
jgi:hypothetical protein